MKASASPTRYPPGWTNVLDKVQQHLTQALASVAAREQGLTAAGTEDQPVQSMVMQDVAGLAERFANLEALAPRAQQALTELDQRLSQGEEEIRQFLANVEASRRRLADWAGRAIG